MWVVLGLIAIVATFINLYMYKTGKDYRLAMAVGLSFTALTLVAEYRLVSNWVKVEDWSALLDVVPSMEKSIMVSYNCFNFTKYITYIIRIKKQRIIAQDTAFILY